MGLKSLETVSTDGPVGAEMEVDRAEFTGCGLRAAVQVQGTYTALDTTCEIMVVV